MPHSATALIIVDAQESFRHRPYWSGAEAPAFLSHLQALADGAKARGIPVVQVFHVEDSGAFSLASGHVRTFEGLSLDPAVVIHKRSHSALVGSGLDVWLVQRGIRRLIVSGIRTEQCCETTTRHAADIGYDVDYVTEATLTFAMTGRDGRVWSPADIRARTELVLADRFARITTVAEALAGAPASLAA
ncbi:MAG TPA: isochorismatase family protein [Xanthomonadaceae bacterium]|jgi:nicotinamidase-related amidase